MNSALRSGIYYLGKTVTGLDTTNFFYGDAKHSQQSSYCIFYGIDNPFDFDSGSQFEVDHVQFSFFGTVLSTLETLAENFQAVFDFGTLTVSGYSFIGMKRTLSLPARKTDKVWQIILEYEIETQKSR